MLPKSVSGQTSACPPRSVAVAAPVVGAPQIDVKMGDPKRQLPQSGNAPKRAKSLEKEYIVVPGASGGAAAAAGLSTSSPPSPSLGPEVVSGCATAPQLGTGSEDSKLSKPAASAADAAGTIALLRAGNGTTQHVARFAYRHARTPFGGALANVVPILASAVPGTLFSLAQDSTGLAGTRIGNAVRIKRIIVKVRLAAGSSAVAGIPAVVGEFLQLPRVRLVVVVDRMAELGGFVWAEMFATAPLAFNAMMWSPTATAAASQQNNTVLRFNPNTFGYRFTVMHDKVYDLNHVSDSSGQSQVVAGAMQIKNANWRLDADIDFHNMQQLYNGPLNTDFVTNTPYWILIRDKSQDEVAAVRVNEYLYDFEVEGIYSDVENTAPDG